MTRSRTVSNGIVVALFAIFCIGVLEFLAINVGQGNPVSSNYTVHAVFTDADGVPTQADVRVSGVDVGKVLDISHDPSLPGETVLTLQITDSKAVPLYSNGYATIRPKTLLGEKYVDLSVGNGSTASPIAPGGFLPLAQTGKSVSNDEIFNALSDPTSRKQQQTVLAALDAATFQRSGDIQAILPQLSTVVNNLRPFTDVYEKDQPQVDDIFVQLNTIMQTLADEHQQLAGMLSNGNVALGAIAQKDQALLGTLQQAANFSTEINNAMAPTIASQRQAIAELGPSLSDQNAFLNQVVGPQSVCGGQPCGIDKVFTGTLLGNINYPNDQLTVSSNAGEMVTTEWDSMFSQPSNDNKALNVVLSFHCDAIPTELNNLGVPASYIQYLQTLLTTLGASC